MSSIMFSTSMDKSKANVKPCDPIVKPEEVSIIGIYHSVIDFIFLISYCMTDFILFQNIFCNIYSISVFSHCLKKKKSNGINKIGKKGFLILDLILCKDNLTESMWRDNK